MSNILACACEHSFQDGRYGKFKRVFVWAEKLFGGVGGWRCTVCLAVKESRKTKVVSKEEV